MHEFGIAFEILKEGDHVPRSYKRVTGHLIFDVKMDFARKARWLLDVHRILSPEGSTHARVVPRESVQITFHALL